MAEKKRVLTRSTGNFAIDTVPLLPKVVLNALKAVQGGHFLRSFVSRGLPTRVVRRVLVLDLLC